jgi:hypothetical protein
MKKFNFLLCLVTMSTFLGTQADDKCTRPGQKCSKALSCGLAQACPFEETVQGVCDPNLRCVVEGDPCVLPNRDLFSSALIKGVYQKDDNGNLHCARTVR